MAESFYRRIEPGRFDSGPLTAGPWSPEAQHAGPPSALLAHEFAAHAPSPDKRVASISIDIYAPVPLAALEVRVETEKPGKSVELLTGTVSVDGKLLMAARAWRVVRAPSDLPTIEAPSRLPLPDGEPRAAMPGTYEDGYLRAVEKRYVQGGVYQREPSSAWLRPLVPLIEDEKTSGLELAMITADSGSGVHIPLNPLEHPGINCTLHVALVRDPEGDMIGLESVTSVAPGGSGLTSTILHDESGPVGTATQTLFYR